MTYNITTCTGTPLNTSDPIPSLPLLRRRRLRATCKAYWRQCNRGISTRSQGLFGAHSLRWPRRTAGKFTSFLFCVPPLPIFRSLLCSLCVFASTLKSLILSFLWSDRLVKMVKMIVIRVSSVRVHTSLLYVFVDDSNDEHATTLHETGTGELGALGFLTRHLVPYIHDRLRLAWLSASSLIVLSHPPPRNDWLIVLREGL
jgi:hypothetical protein